MTTFSARGRTFDLSHYPRLSGTPAEGPAMIAMGQLIAQGLPPSSTIGWSDQVVTASLGEDLAALIVFREAAERDAVSLLLGHTLPAFQRQGVYSALFRAFAADLRAKSKARYIESGYHVANTASAAMHRALGRQVTHHATTFDLQSPMTPAEAALVAAFGRPQP